MIYHFKDSTVEQLIHLVGNQPFYPQTTKYHSDTQECSFTVMRTAEPNCDEYKLVIRNVSEFHHSVEKLSSFPKEDVIQSILCEKLEKPMTSEVHSTPHVLVIQGVHCELKFPMSSIHISAVGKKHSL